MDVKAKKYLGQNFLKDESILGRIVEAAEVGPEDNILEIGPGTGVLTKRLLERSRHVVAVELDHDLVARLEKEFEGSEGLSLLEGNILELDMNERLSALEFEEEKYKVVANIPYYITAPIIKMLLSLSIRPKRIVLLVQDEVADRICAAPGNTSILSVMAQYYADVEKLFFVPKESFDPVPAVDSAVIRLIPKRRFDREGDRKLFRIVRAGFAARRKTLVNNLSSSFRIPRSDIEQMIVSSGLDFRVRAQELSTEQWETLSELLMKNE